MGKEWRSTYVQLSDAGARGKLVLYITFLHILEKEAHPIVTLRPCVVSAVGGAQVSEF